MRTVLKRGGLLSAACALGVLVCSGGARAQDPVAARCPSYAAWQRSHPTPALDPARPQPGASDPALQKRLLALADEDQRLVAELTRARDAGEKDDSKLLARISAFRSKSMDEIKRVVDAHGVPGVRLAGRDGAYAAFLLIQHADWDPFFQAAVLPQFRVLAERKEIPGENYAYLADRVAVAHGRPQRFGTQLQDLGSVLVVRPIDNAATVDERRAQLDLPPMKDYLCLVSARSGLKVEMPPGT